MSTRQTHFENIHKVPAMDLVHHHNRGLLHFSTSNWISYGDFSEVEWKNRMQLHKNQCVTVVRNQFCAVLTGTWITDSYGVRFGSTSGKNVCDNQMLQMILSQGTFGELFLRSSFRNLYRNFLNEQSTNAFREHTQSPRYGPSASS